MIGRSDDGSYHSPVCRKSAVHRPGTSQLPVSSRQLIISRQSVALQKISRTSNRFTNRPVPWWNAACTNAVKKKRAAFSRLRRHLLFSAGRTVADPKTVADLFAEHFASVSRKDPATPGARYLRLATGAFRTYPIPSLLVDAGF
ncbi:hypothetical protein E2C01_050468 [Portunus trituberculatus]|uniref:Uncharacterized protein n=1 Tax=Portunus trituberculatus TaxID=210409 RepID=A0A5B7GGV0_PORTR|nr:hypothetical protein [Portunus trituberculatus]